MAFSSDLDQITRAAAGERQAVSALVNRYSRAWKALPDWEPRAKFSTWLHRVALNLCYDRLRKRREATMAEPPEQVDMALRPDDALDQAERVKAVEAAIAALPERQAAALTLCALQDHSQSDAADIMEISVEALESLLARARRTLRAVLLERSEA